MLKFKLKIEVLSDMCCGSGEGNGAEQDVISSYDEWGIPIIPGKRIKGLLSEKAEFLVANKYLGIEDETLVRRVFGTGEKAGLIRVGNAEIKDALSIKKELNHLEAGLASCVNPSRVKKVFTVNRNSTTVEESGIAKNKSLRTIGAVPKGEVFFANISLNSTSIENKEIQLLKASVKLLRGIGLNRNRGFGEVRCELIEEMSERVQKRKESYSVLEKAEVLDYVILLEDSSITRGDYISGSALQGFFVNKLGQDKEEVKDFFEKVRFSNAYISDGLRRFLPLPLGMLSVKGDETEIYSDVDGVELKKTEIYVKPNGYYFLDNNIFIKHKVVNKEEFHYAKKTRNLFRIKSLEKGQAFKGSIYGDTESLRKLVDIINENQGELTLGASATAQYAKSKMIILNKKEDESQKEGNENKENILSLLNDGKKLVVEFLSDTILVDEMGCNLTNVSILEQKMETLFGLKVKIRKICTKIVTVGGYNSAWSLPKRRYTAFAKGTQILVEKEEGFEINHEKETDAKKIIPQKGFIGLLQSEGYGEYIIREQFKENVFSVGEYSETKEKASIPVKAKPILSKVLFSIADEVCALKAGEAVENYNPKSEKLSVTTAMKLINVYRHVQGGDEGENLYDRAKAYIDCNFSGDNNVKIKKYAEYLLNEFIKIQEDEDYLEEVRKVFEEDEKKNKLFSQFFEYFIFFTKLHYRKGEA